MYDKKDWKVINNKRLRSSYNKELVTLRAVVRAQNSTRITISIGLIVCDLLDFKKSDRVCIKTHQNKKSIILIEKTLDEGGYKLCGAGSSPLVRRKSNFLFFCINSNYYHDYKLSQTIICDYDILSKNKLLIDFSKLKWRK